MREQPTRVLVVGAKDVAGLPPLFENRQFAGRLFTDSSRTKLLELHFAAEEPAAGKASPPLQWGGVKPRPELSESNAKADAHAQVQAGQYEAAL